MKEQGWKPNIDGQESIIFYKYNPKAAKKYENTKSRYFTNRSKESTNVVDEKGKVVTYAYEVTYKKRDKNIKRIRIQLMR